MLERRKIFKKFASAALSMILPTCILLSNAGCGNVYLSDLRVRASSRPTEIKYKIYTNKLDKDRWDISLKLLNLRLSDVKKLELIPHPPYEMELIELEESGNFFVTANWPITKEYFYGGYFKKLPPLQFTLVLQDESKHLIKAKYDFIGDLYAFCRLVEILLPVIIHFL